jgi:hypothetical protein
MCRSRSARQRPGTSPGRTRSGPAGHRRAGQESLGRLQVDRSAAARGIGRLRIRRGGFASLLEDEVDRRPIHALDPQLVADRPLATRPGTVARLDPGSGKRFVVEDAELDHPLDGGLDEVRPVAGERQATPDLVDRPRSRLEESRRRLEHDHRVVDRSLPLPGLCGRSSSPWHRA